MEATIEAIKELRSRTGSGVNAVKQALQNSNDIEEAIQYLREKGEVKAAKRAGKATENGVLGLYMHNDNRLAVLVEVATETDFASRSEAVKKFADDIALHIAVIKTEYISKDSIPEEVIENEKAVARKDVEGKPEDVANKIIDGKLQKFYKENVLTYQYLFTDESKTVEDYMNELVAQVGEKVIITRFVKMQIAQPTLSCSVDLSNVS